jgi:hypothetical protein
VLVVLAVEVVEAVVVLFVVQELSPLRHLPDY